MNYFYIALICLDIAVITAERNSAVIRAIGGIAIAALSFLLGAQAAFSGIIAP